MSRIQSQESDLCAISLASDQKQNVIFASYYLPKALKNWDLDIEKLTVQKSHVFKDFECNR